MNIRERFIAWMSEEMCFSPEEMAFDDARRCFADLRIHIAWCAYREAAQSAFQRGYRQGKQQLQGLTDEQFEAAMQRDVPGWHPNAKLAVFAHVVRHAVERALLENIT